VGFLLRQLPPGYRALEKPTVSKPLTVATNYARNCHYILQCSVGDEWVAHRYADFAFPCGFASRVRVKKHLNTARIWGDPRRNANYAYLLATVTSGLPASAHFVLPFQSSWY
jgi:hypothetical protein